MGSGLLGAWQDVDDKSSMEIERGEWKSYRIKYVHPIESGVLTGHLTCIGDDRFLDVMPAAARIAGRSWFLCTPCCASCSTAIGSSSRRSPTTG